MALGHRLVYLAYPPEPPRWAAWVAQRVDQIGATAYQPFDSIRKKLAADPLFRALVDRTLAPTDLARQIGSFSPWMLEPLRAGRIDRLAGADVPNPLVDDIVGPELYVLLRAAIVLVDLNRPAFAGTTAVAFHAHQLGIPVWGVADRIVTAPWFLAHADGVVRSGAVADLVYDLLGLTG